MAGNRVIGIDNALPWRLPADLQHFKRLTLGHHILMGRKTWDSLGRPLPGRTSVVITRSRDFAAPGCLVAGSPEDAIAVCAGDEEIFFIGGADLYRQALPFADRLYLTEIRRDFAGDAWFPEFDRSVWRETERRREATDGLEYDFVIYDKEI